MIVIKFNSLARYLRRADAVQTKAEDICLDGGGTPHHDAH